MHKMATEWTDVPKRDFAKSKIIVGSSDTAQVPRIKSTLTQHLSFSASLPFSSFLFSRESLSFNSVCLPC